MAEAAKALRGWLERSSMEFTEEANERKLEPADPEKTEYVEAGPITFGVEYRFLYQRGADGRLTEEVNDHGVTIHVYEGRGNKAPEHLRFDCLLIRPHHHYVNWALRRQQHIYYDTAACGDMLPWSLERLRTRLVSMLITAGAAELASRIDPREIEAALPKVAAWAEVVRERAQVNWRGSVHLTGAGIYAYRQMAGAPMKANRAGAVGQTRG